MLFLVNRSSLAKTSMTLAVVSRPLRNQLNNYHIELTILGLWNGLKYEAQKRIPI